MLLTACVILFVFWLLGILNSYTFGGYMHILLGITIVVTVMQLIRRRNDLVRLKRRYKGEFQLQTQFRAQNWQNGV
jgi:hypothetical protein